MKTCAFLTTSLLRLQTEMVASLTSVTNNKLHDIKKEMTIFTVQLEDICIDVSTMKEMFRDNFKQAREKHSMAQMGEVEKSGFTS